MHAQRPYIGWKPNLLSMGRARVAILCATLLAPVEARAQGVVVDGTVVPKERFIVFLFAGNSNMVGREKGFDKSTHPRAWNFQLKDYNHRTEVGWTPAKGTLHADTGKAGGGPGVPFLKAIVQAYPDYTFGVVANPQRNSSINPDASDQKLAYRKGGKLYNELLTAAKKVQGDATLGGIVLWSGEIEAGDQRQANSFAQDVKAMVESLRTDLGQPALPVFINEHPEHAPTLRHHYKTVQEQAATVPTIVNAASQVGFQCPKGNFVDEYHLNAGCYESWAKELVHDHIVPGGDHAPLHPWYPAKGSTQPGTDPGLGPRAAIRAAPFVALGKSLFLDGSGSSSNRKLVAYRWDFGDGETGEGVSTTHAWQSLGVTTVKLTVEDEGGATAQATASIDVVQSTKPSIDIAAPAGNEVWAAGSKQVIEWDTRFLNDVAMMYSSDNGKNWQHVGYCDIDSSEWQAYPWLVPNTPCKDCLFLIRGYDNEAQTVSQSFTIVAGSDQPQDASPTEIVGGCSSPIGPLAVIWGSTFTRLRRRIRRSRWRDAKAAQAIADLE